MTRIWGVLARIPNSVVAALLVVAGVLIPLHEWLVARMHAAGGEEWPQWVGYVAVKWYWAFLPLAALALWARRRTTQGLLGRIGAVLNLVGGPLQYGVLLVSTVVWGLLLGRGDLPAALMSVEFLTYLIVPGMVLAGIAMLRDRALPRWQGVLVLLLPIAAWLPFGALAVGLVLGVLLVTKGRDTGRVLDSPVPATAR